MQRLCLIQQQWLAGYDFTKLLQNTIMSVVICLALVSPSIKFLRQFCSVYFWRTNMIDANTVQDSSLVSSGLCDSLNANHNSRVYCSIHLLCDPCLHSCRQYSMITLVPTVYWYNQLPAVSPAISDINAENVRVNLNSSSSRSPTSVKLVTTNKILLL